jgi:hypothetical protein
MMIFAMGSGAGNAVVVAQHFAQGGGAIVHHRIDDRQASDELSPTPMLRIWPLDVLDELQFEPGFAEGFWRVKCAAALGVQVSVGALTAADFEQAFDTL